MTQAAFIHPQALCETKKIAERTRVWAFTHILSGAVLGVDCNICDHVFIENDVKIGDRVTIKSGVQLWDGIVLEDDVFVGPNATFANDKFPRSKKYPSKFEITVVRSHASIGANATILPGVEIGTGAMVGAGAVVTRSVPPHAIVVGNPARIVGYVTGEKPQTDAQELTKLADGVKPLGVGGAMWHRLPKYKDLRGQLAVYEFEKSIPFVPKRSFIVFDVPSSEVRGEHAHKVCRQFLICIRGAVSVLLDDGKSRCDLTLTGADEGVDMPAMIWGTQYRYTKDAILLVFASHRYDSDDYIRDYSEFKALAGVT